MKRTRLALAILLIAASFAAGDEPKDGGTVVTRPLVRLRGGPGPIFPVKAVAKRGTLIRTGAESGDGRWQAVSALEAKKNGGTQPIRAFTAEDPAWVAKRDLAAPAKTKTPVQVAGADEVKVVAASVAACVRGFDDRVIEYLNAHEIDRKVLDCILQRPFTPEQYRRFVEARLPDGKFRMLELPFEIPDDFADAVTMDRLAAMVGVQLAESLGGKLAENDGARRYVACVGTLLGEASPRYELTYRFVLIDHETPNTFCAPGGIVVVTTGVLALCRDESELAGVLAHELGHIVLQHAERSPELKAREIGINTDRLWADLEGETRGAPGVSKATEKELNNLAEWFITVTLSRTRRLQEEYEADRMAVWLLANCGYDPTALHRVLQRLHADRTPLPFEDKLLRNHPTRKERIEALDKVLKSYRKLSGKRYQAEYGAVLGAQD
jgi:hypothetical protein